MATDLSLYGPIEIPCPNDGAAKFIDKAQKKAFLATLEEEGLAAKQGCYIFALRAGRGYCPWYVGKATKSMKQECMGSHQLQHYNAVLNRGQKGTPVMFFALPGGKKKKVPTKICAEMEEVLIQAGMYENPDLRNVQKAKTPEWGIDGVLRGKKGKPTADETSFCKMMGFDN
jgi:hypothetical protein